MAIRGLKHYKYDANTDRLSELEGLWRTVGKLPAVTYKHLQTKVLCYTATIFHDVKYDYDTIARYVMFGDLPLVVWNNNAWRKYREVKGVERYEIDYNKSEAKRLSGNPVYLFHDAFMRPYTWQGRINTVVMMTFSAGKKAMGRNRSHDYKNFKQFYYDGEGWKKVEFWNGKWRQFISKIK